VTYGVAVSTRYKEFDPEHLKRSALVTPDVEGLPVLFGVFSPVLKKVTFISLAKIGTY